MSVTPNNDMGAGQTPAPALYELKATGEVLVLLDACGHRLDEIMGQRDHLVIQRRLQGLGLLDERGEPTSAGGAAARAFLERRKEAERKARELEEIAALTKPKGPNP